MANRYCNLIGSKKISEDFGNINVGFDKVQQEMDADKGTAAAHIANADIHVTKAKQDDWTSKAAGNHRHANATATADGFMPSTDKAKMDASTPNATANTLAQRDANGRMKASAPTASDDVARKADVDTVQKNLDGHIANADIHVSKVKKDEWDSKAAGNHRHANATAAVDGFMSKGDFSKLKDIQPGAETNQNAFAAVKVSGQSDVKASAKTDALNIAGGTGITITTNPNTKTVNITATGVATPGKHALAHITGGTDVIPDATTTASGLMSLKDKKDLEKVKQDLSRVDLSLPANQGANVITTDMASPLSLDIEGLSLSNIVVNGSFAKDSNNDGLADGWRSIASGATLSIVDGKQRITATANDTQNWRLVAQVSIYEPSNNYVLIGKLETDGTSLGSIAVWDSIENKQIKETAYSAGGLLILSFTAPSASMEIRAINRNSVGTVGWVQFDDIRVYKIDASIASKIGIDPEWSGDKIAVKYPYMDGTTSINGVAITKRGKNLLPPFTEWVSDPGSSQEINAPYRVRHTMQRAAQYLGTVVKVVPGQTYLLSVSEMTDGARIRVGANDGRNFYDGTFLGNVYSQMKKSKITIPNGVIEIVVAIMNMPDTPTYPITIDCVDPIMSVGDVAMPFEPQNDDTVTLPVTLAKVGDIADRIYWRDGAFRKWHAVDIAADGTPTVRPKPIEEIVSTAGLSLHVGGNQIEIETGFKRNDAGEIIRVPSANVINATAKYTTGISGVLSDTVQNVADVQGQNGRQDEWLLINEAKTANVRFDMDEHTNNKNNPHAVTAAQVGAETPAGAQAKANQAETNAKAASLPRTGGTVEGPLKLSSTLEVTSVLTGASIVNSRGYFEIGPYNTSYGNGKVQQYYDANRKLLIIDGRDAAGGKVAVDISIAGIKLVEEINKLKAEIEALKTGGS